MVTRTKPDMYCGIHCVSNATNAGYNGASPLIKVYAMQIVLLDKLLNYRLQSVVRYKRQLGPPETMTPLNPILLMHVQLNVS